MNPILINHLQKIRLISMVLLMGVAPLKGHLQNPSPPKDMIAYTATPSKANALAAATATYFTQNLQMNPDPNNQIADFAPVVATHENEIYVVWNGDETVKSIFFSRSTDGGSTFSVPLVINDSVNYPPGFSVYQPDIAVDGEGAIYIVWHDYRAWTDDLDYSSPIEIYLDKSTDGGLTWGDDIQVSNGSGSYPWHFQPHLDINRNSGHILVSFTDYDRYAGGDYGDVSFVRSTDGGLNFNTKIRVDDTPEFSNTIQLFSHVAVNQKNGDILVTWQDSRNGNYDIYMAKSIDNGMTFGSNILVNSVQTNNQEEPNVVIDTLSGNIYIAWKDWRSDDISDTLNFDNDIYLAKSIDGGLTFTGDVRVTDMFMQAKSGFNNPPDLAIDSLGILYVVWHDNRMGFSNVYYDQSIDQGTSFGTDLQVNTDMQMLSHALPRIICTSGGESLITWMDKRNGENYDIFLAGSILESCPANINLSGSILDGNYHAGISAIINAELIAGGQITLTSGESIVMLQDFQISTGASFEAALGGCP